MDDKFYVRTIRRSDGQRFDFDAREFYLSTENSLLVRPGVQSTEVEYTDEDGGEMINQRLPIHEQIFNGIMYPRTSEYWSLYFKLTSFFLKNYTYDIVYKRRDGSLMQQKGAWLGPNNIQIEPKPYEDYSPWSVGLKLGSSMLLEYAEDDEGNEVYANSVILPLVTSSAGGQLWDSVGQVWDAVGSVWEAGNGGVQNIFFGSTRPVYPVWTVDSEAINPKLQNNTTDTFAEYLGTVASGQTLVVDFAAGTARLDGALVTRNINGQVQFRAGNNLAGFNTDGGAATSSKLEWNNVIG